LGMNCVTKMNCQFVPAVTLLKTCELCDLFLQCGLASVGLSKFEPVDYSGTGWEWQCGDGRGRLGAAHESSRDSRYR
jgi:hypothetical protein